MNAVELRDAAHELADIADALTLQAFRRPFDVQTKPDGSWVTDIDVAVERRLRDEIMARFPSHMVVGEEDGASGAAEDAHTPEWVLDPIDGTSNFVRGNPIFATLIAVEVDGDHVASVVSAPALASRWDAARGVGARQDGREIRVSTRATLDSAEVAFGGLQHLIDAGYRNAVLELTGSTARQRGYGDFWQHCLVACGSTDIALEADVKRWDLAAVRGVVECAGGTFSSFSGERTASGGSAVSTNGQLHDAVLEILQH